MKRPIERLLVEWLLIEWPEDEQEPTKDWLSTLPKAVALSDMVDLAKLRRRIERDHQELKQELGLRRYEGRAWRSALPSLIAHASKRSHGTSRHTQYDPNNHKAAQ